MNVELSLLGGIHMCGRFTLHTSIDELVERFGVLDFAFSYTPSYNIAPTQPVLTVVAGEKSPEARYMRWGLVPPWQQKSPSRPLINARLETVSEKPTFRRLVNTKRCLILADGFFEWKQEESTKYPVYIRLDQGKPFAFAGLWDNDEKPSCTIITQDAASALASVHNRMPVILTPESEVLWLSNAPFSELQSQLPDEESLSLSYYRVSTQVNSPRNNGPLCIVPEPIRE